MQIKNLKPYVCGSVLNQSEELLISVTPNRYIRCFDIAHLVLINRVQNKSRGNFKFSDTNAGNPALNERQAIGDVATKAVVAGSDGKRVCSEESFS
jgi:hypothetical protein